MSERFPVQLVSRLGAASTGVFVIDDEEDGDNCKLVFQHSDSEITASASDFFEAMCQIRGQLEALGWLPICYGSSFNVYPSGMCRGMGRGLKAYKLQIGQQARIIDLVEILQAGAGIEPSTVAEQKDFFDCWLKSLQ